MNMEPVESVGINVVDDASDNERGGLVGLVQEEGTWKFENLIQIVQMKKQECNIVLKLDGQHLIY